MTLLARISGIPAPHEIRGPEPLLLADPEDPVPPRASLAVHPTLGVSPLEVTFYPRGQDTDLIKTYVLDFADGNVQMADWPAGKIEHTYTLAETDCTMADPREVCRRGTTFKASLVLTDETGLKSDSAVARVRVFPHIDPEVILSAAPASGETPLDVTLSARVRQPWWQRRESAPYTYTVDPGNGGGVLTNTSGRFHVRYENTTSCTPDEGAACQPLTFTASVEVRDRLGNLVGEDTVSILVYPAGGSPNLGPHLTLFGGAGLQARSDGGTVSVRIGYVRDDQPLTAMTFRAQDPSIADPPRLPQIRLLRTFQWSAGERRFAGLVALVWAPGAQLAGSRVLSVTAVDRRGAASQARTVKVAVRPASLS